MASPGLFHQREDWRDHLFNTAPPDAAAADWRIIMSTTRARKMAAPLLAVSVTLATAAPLAAADTIPVEVLDRNLQVTTYLAGLARPIGIAFIGPDDAFILEKASGLVKRATNGVIQAEPVLDLAVNSASERGLLGIALHPDFPALPFVYISWTESATGLDTTVLSEVPLLGNRVDRFIWDGTRLTLDPNFQTVRLRAGQTDNLPVRGHEEAVNPDEQGNHNGGPIRFGPDGKLYVFRGDVGRRGQMQNLPFGPFSSRSFRDDTYGGPAPDSEHLSGVVQRFNDDGSTPTDNPFHGIGRLVGGDTGRMLRTVFSYGHRNGFGMAFDPYSRFLWLTENADDAFSEVNRIVPGMNGGWIQVMGPLSRVAEFRQIEATMFDTALGQVRYSPTRIADTPDGARSRMFMLPGATYVDPQFSWRYEVGPAGAGFVRGNALGADYDGTLWIGSSRPFSATAATGGSLYRLRLTSDRLEVDVGADARLADKVADNVANFESTESETLLIGRGFGVTPAIEQGPDGNLYVVSLTDGVVYRISRAATP
jgi:glucose/arabinose dehydrogenase